MSSSEETEFLTTIRDAIQILTGNQFGDLERYRFHAKVIQKMMNAGNFNSLEDFFEALCSDSILHAEFISRITIHHTQWFREPEHFVSLEKVATQFAIDQEKLSIKDTFKVWSAASSTGEEVGSIAITLQRVKEKCRWFEYSILGTDLDDLCIAAAKANRFPFVELNKVKPEYMEYFVRDGKYASLREDLFKRCRFETNNLVHSSPTDTTFHVIFIRNVLIYFSQETAFDVLRKLSSSLSHDGLMYLGHCEAQNYERIGLKASSHAIYRRIKDITRHRRKILLLEDSAIARMKMKKVLESYNYEVLIAENISQADALLTDESTGRPRHFDGFCLDINLPDGYGPNWLRKQRSNGNKTPALIVSQIHKEEAKKNFEDLFDIAEEYFEKNLLHSGAHLIPEFFDQIQAQKVGHHDPSSKGTSATPVTCPTLILIGTSTGGPKALTDFLKDWNTGSPPIVLVQHMAHSFLKAFAERMETISGLKLWDGNDGPLKNGHIYIALADYHVKVRRRSDRTWEIYKDYSVKVHQHRPSVDVLFGGVEGAGEDVVAVLLTGMGKDGAQGMKSLFNKGAYTMAQDEQSSVVWGMPGEAVKLGGARTIGNIQKLRKQLSHIITLPPAQPTNVSELKTSLISKPSA